MIQPTPREWAHETERILRSANRALSKYVSIHDVSGKADLLRLDVSGYVVGVNEVTPDRDVPLIW